MATDLTPVPVTTGVRVGPAAVPVSAPETRPARSTTGWWLAGSVLAGAAAAVAAAVAVVANVTLPIPL